MPRPHDKLYELLLSRKFGQHFRRSLAHRTVPRLIFYAVFCPLVLFTSIAAGLISKNRGWIAGLLGGEAGICTGLFVWVRLWAWTKQRAYRQWRQHYESD